MLLFAEGGHHSPLIVEFINHYLGEPVHKFQVENTKPIWDKFFGYFGSNAETVFGEYRVDNAIPWYTVMFFIACLLTMALIWIFKGRLSEDDPTPGQLTLEAGFLTLKEMIESVVGPHGMKYFPVVATFAVLILVSNLMGFFPIFMSPTASTSVTFALGISSFIYYNFVGIRENGIISHLGHLAGPVWWLAWFIFPLELISNFIRPLSLSIRLFGNIFADEKVAETVAGLGQNFGIPEPGTQLLVPIILMPLGLLVCLVQTFVFTLLSMIYLGEVSHGDHGHDEEHAHGEVAEAHA